MEHKAGPLVEVKVLDESKGEVEAVFSTLNVVDKDKDVTLPGAFGEQDVRISAYNHGSWGGELPVGIGKISETSKEAIMKGRFFMDVPKAHDTFTTLKELGGLMEWSYGYDILERSEGMWPPDDSSGQQVQFLKKLKVHEVSPVILGAGVDTRTLSAKASSDPLTAAQITAAKRIIAQIMALLNGGDPPKQNAVDSLIDKLESAIGVQETSSAEVEGLKLIDHVNWVHVEFDEVSTRAAEAMAMRAEKGEQLAEPTLTALKALLDSSERLREALAIESADQINPKQQVLVEQLFRDSRTLLYLTGGSE